MYVKLKKLRNIANSEVRFRKLANPPLRTEAPLASKRTLVDGKSKSHSHRVRKSETDFETAWLTVFAAPGSPLTPAKGSTASVPQ
jgi:hypothetical protein